MTTITLADLKLSLEQRRRLEVLRAREKPEGSTPVCARCGEGERSGKWSCYLAHVKGRD